MLEDICDIALSIHFAKSEDIQSCDVRRPQVKNKSNYEKVKCFKCYGTGKRNCTECQDTQLIQFQHPLAKLLNSILNKKLNLGKDKQVKEEQQFEQVYPIKEQEQDTDQRKLMCSYCQSDCEQIFYYCSICPFLHICQLCQRKNINHEHEILRSKLLSTCKIQFSASDSCKRCYNCAKQIENCYSACKTCLEKGDNFWVCDTCSDSKTYVHSASHIFQTVMDYNDQGDNQIETISQELQIEDKFAQLDQQKMEDTQNQYFQEQNKNHFLVKKNSSIVDYVECIQQQDQLPSLSYNKSDDNPRKNDYVSRVKFEFDQNLFNSYEFTNENKPITKKILCPPKVCYEDRFSYSQSHSHSNCKQNQLRDQNCQFSFSGYRCDICEIEPIKNVRYHCTTCEDFDVCQKCFETCLKTHDHITFDKIDHEEMKKKVMNKIFQQRDCNMKGSANLVHRRITNRSKTVRFSSINA